MRIVVVGYDKMFSNLILGSLESKNKVVGVFRHERVTIHPFLLFFKDIFAPGKDYSFIKSLKLKEIKARSVNSKTFKQEVLKLNPDIILVGSWSEKFKKPIIELPKIGTINCHPSLLPKYRGYGAVSEQFIRGVVYSGVTIYEYNGIIDGGDIIYQQEIKIENYFKVSDLMDRQANITAEFIASLYKGEQYSRIKQQEEYAFYLPKIRKNSKKIDFNADALSVYNFIRAYTFPFSGAVFYFKGEEYKITDAALESWSGIEGRPGEIVAVNDYGIVAACGEGSVLIKEVEYNGQIMKSLMINIYDGEILI